MPMLRVMMLLAGFGILMFPGLSVSGEKEITDRVSFQIEVGRDVENDRVVAMMHVTAEDKSPARLADAVNKDMSWALDQARAVSSIKVSSGGYQTYPVYDDQKIVRWRARQELQLESQNVDQLSELIGTLQSRLQMQSMQFSVSPEQRQQVEEQLIEEALVGYQRRAELIVKSLGAKGYGLVDVAVQTGRHDQIIPLRAEAMSMMSKASVAPPALEKGTSRVTVQASGTIRLRRD